MTYNSKHKSIGYFVNSEAYFDSDLKKKGKFLLKKDLQTDISDI